MEIWRSTRGYPFPTSFKTIVFGSLVECWNLDLEQLVAGQSLAVVVRILVDVEIVGIEIVEVVVVEVVAGAPRALRSDPFPLLDYFAVVLVGREILGRFRNVRYLPAQAPRIPTQFILKFAKTKKHIHRNENKQKSKRKISLPSPPFAFLSSIYATITNSALWSPRSSSFLTQCVISTERENVLLIFLDTFLFVYFVYFSLGQK